MDRNRETAAHDIEPAYTAGIVGGSDLAKMLGYPSTAAMTQADNRGTLPVHTFRIPGRRGRFALRHEVHAWVRALHTKSTTQGAES